MGLRRAAALLAGWVLVTASASFASSREAAPADMPIEIVHPAPSAGSVREDAPFGPLPDVPPVTISLDLATPEPTATGAISAVAVPEPPPAAVTLSPADLAQGALQLRLGEPGAIWPQRLPRKERDALLAFYRGREGRPLWIGREGWNAAAAGLVGRLARADEDGLDAAEYPAPLSAAGSPAELAEAELKLSALAVLYGRDARGGRIEPSRLSGLITPRLDLPGAEAVMAGLAASADPAATLAAYHPPHAGYLALKAKLADLRQNRPASAVPMARRRPPGPELTTQAIAVLDDAPILRPAGPYANPRLEGDLVANMERWRWLPADLGERYVAVNVPEYRLQLIDGGRVAHETRVIVGKPESATPVFSGMMEYAVVNPSWYVPPSILKKEFLPKLAADPDYAARLGYQVTRKGNSISIRQPPGEKNALGFIKFMFPNNHAVYLHDTPNRRLFSASRRAFSHGCVRVENPFVLADFVLGAEWTESRLRKLIGRGERTIRLPQHLPVHLTYFTTSVDGTGELATFEDLYGFNRRVRAALGLGA